MQLMRVMRVAVTLLNICIRDRYTCIPACRVLLVFAWHIDCEYGVILQGENTGLKI